MKVREYTSEDYAPLTKWWKGHGWEPVPEAVLPKLGMIVDGDDGVALCAGWLYMDNSVGVCMFEWLVTDPEAKPLVTAKSVKTLVSFMADRALEMDYGVMLTTCRQPSLARMYQRCGFIKTDEGVTHLLRMLKKSEE
jgi:hypothetical protein